MKNSGRLKLIGYSNFKVNRYLHVLQNVTVRFNFLLVSLDCLRHLHCKTLGPVDHKASYVIRFEIFALLNML